MKPIAVLCADLHLSLLPPPARAEEPNWFAAMARPLHELGRLARQEDVPILCAGDVFHRWDAPPELINFALAHLPPMYAIPGQHDLPYHNHEDLDKSAFGTLVRAGKITLLSPDRPTLLPGGFAWGFGWNTPITPLAQDTPFSGVAIAVVHAYCWQHKASYQGADEGAHVRAFRDRLFGYDAAVFGDNHKGFLKEFPGLTLFNCGGFMRRRTDEAGSSPMVGLLYDNGRVRPYPLDTSHDKFSQATPTVQQEHEAAEIEAFVRRLGETQPESFDFAAAVVHFIEAHEVAPGVKQILLEAILPPK